MRTDPTPRNLAALAILIGALTAVCAHAVPRSAGVRAAHAPRAALPAAQTPFSARLPDGDGRAIAERACVLCHSGMLITQQGKDSTGWAKTLTLMQKWGAPFSAGERDTLQAWLSARLGPRAH